MWIDRLEITMDKFKHISYIIIIDDWKVLCKDFSTSFIGKFKEYFILEINNQLQFLQVYYE